MTRKHLLNSCRASNQGRANTQRLTQRERGRVARMPERLALACIVISTRLYMCLIAVD